MNVSGSRRTNPVRRRKAFDGVHVVGFVHGDDLLSRCLGGRDGLEVCEQPGFVQVIEDGLETGRSFRVSRPHLVLEARRMGDECGHAWHPARACRIAGFRA